MHGIPRTKNQEEGYEMFLAGSLLSEEARTYSKKKAVHSHTICRTRAMLIRLLYCYRVDRTGKFYEGRTLAV